MATLDEIAEALRRADAAGNVEDARALAEAYRAKQAEMSPGPQAQQYDPSQPYSPGAFGNNPAAQDMPAGSEPQPPASFDDYVRSFGANIDQIPIAGPTIYDAMRLARANVQGMTPEQVDAETAAARQRAPGADIAGKLAYNIAPYAIAGAFGPTSRALGFTGANLGPGASIAEKGMDLLTRSGAAFGSNMLIGTADSMARGEGLPEAAQNNLIPSLVVGGVPTVAAGARPGGRLLAKGADWALGNGPSTFWRLMNKDVAAQKLVGKTMTADRSAGVALTDAEDAAALARGQQLTNLDRGGPATRNIARVAAGKSPEGKSALVSATEPARAPGLDTGEFLTKLVGGSADDLQLRQGLRDQGRLVNDPAYRKAYSAPAAQSIWSNDLANMFQSKEFASAVRDAENIGRTRAAAQGGKAVANPFVFKTMPDGSVAVSMKPGVTPSLEFWDKVKIGLDRQIEALGPTERSRLADLTAVKQRLVSMLDNAVPDYKAARMGAAGFFGAEDAMDAGRKFALQPKNLPEALKAFNAMSDVDKKAFRIGAASSTIDKLKTGDTFAVVKSTFENPAAREFWRGVLGPQKAGELEAYVRVQAIQNASRQAVVGGSQTADLLFGAGLGGAGVAADQIAPGNWFSGPAYFIALGRVGHHYLGKSADKQVMTKVAELLASGDKAALNKIMFNASVSKQWMQALAAITEGAARGTVVASMGMMAPQAAAAPWPKTDTRDYSNGLPPPVSQGPRSVPVP